MTNRKINSKKRKNNLGSISHTVRDAYGFKVAWRGRGRGEWEGGVRKGWEEGKERMDREGEG